MRTHVVRGEQILRGGRTHGLARHGGRLPAPRTHRRTRLPPALEPPHIHLFGRITAIADAYDAMTSDRSYQRAMKPVEALHLMSTQLASHFDQSLLAQFVKTLRAPPS